MLTSVLIEHEILTALLYFNFAVNVKLAYQSIELRNYTFRVIFLKYSNQAWYGDSPCLVVNPFLTRAAPGILVTGLQIFCCMHTKSRGFP